MWGLFSQPLESGIEKKEEKKKKKKSIKTPTGNLTCNQYILNAFLFTPE